MEGTQAFNKVEVMFSLFNMAIILQISLLFQMRIILEFRMSVLNKFFFLK